MCIRDRNGIALEENRACAQRAGIADDELAAVIQYGVSAIGVGIVAVSYTHLDVYKRQA